MFSIISVSDSGAQVQRMRRTSPVRDIHIAQFETLIKGKEGQHEEDWTCDETSLLYDLHAWPCLIYRTGSSSRSTEDRVAKADHSPS